jgi:UDP-glucose 4-epimerase
VCGAGFIGTHLIAQLLVEGFDVNVLDHNPCPPTLVGRANWFCGEFTDERLLRGALQGAEVAYHLVSSTVPGDDHVEVIQELSDNIFATLRFIDACVASEVQRIVFVSSSSVYGLQQVTPIRETAQTDPISSHGIHKLTIEKYLLLYRFNHDIDVRIIRLSNPFGPGQNLHGRQGFIAIAIGNVLGVRPILLRDAGSPIRDFIYIDDVARALVLAGFTAGAPSVINIGTGTGYSLADVVALVGEVLGRRMSVERGDLRRVDIPVSVLDIELARRSINFEPTITLREGLVRTLHHHGLETV